MLLHKEFTSNVSSWQDVATTFWFFVVTLESANVLVMEYGYTYMIHLNFVQKKQQRTLSESLTISNILIT